MGNRLREAREYLGFSQEEVATYMGVSRSALSNIETGQRRIDVVEFMALADAIGFDAADAIRQLYRIPKK